jgi:hypothetical protein
MTAILEFDTDKKLDESLIASIKDLCHRHGVAVRLREMEEGLPQWMKNDLDERLNDGSDMYLSEEESLKRLEVESYNIPQEAIDEAERRLNDPNARYLSRDEVSKGMRDILGV